MKKSFLLLPVILCFAYALLTSSSSGYSSDVTGATGATSGCGSGCHGTAATSAIATTVYLDSAGTRVTHYVPGRSYTIIISAVNNTSGSLPNFGFELAAVRLAGSGSSTVTDAGTWGTLPSGYRNLTVGSRHIIEQSTRLSPSTGSGGGGGATTYTVRMPWTAPSAGTGAVKLYGILNAINNNSTDDAGDKWNTDVDTVVELTASTTTVAGIHGASNICVGDSTLYTDSTTGGSWSVTPTSVATIRSNGRLFGVSGGSATVSYTVGTTSATFPITVQAPPPAPGPIVGSTSMCAGTDTTYTDTTAGGVWASSNTSVATITAGGRVHAITAGTTMIDYTVTAPCGSHTASTGRFVMLTVSMPPSTGTISGSAAVCPGTTSTYTETLTGGTWSSSNTTVATISSTGSLSALSPGLTTVSYTLTSSCGVVAATRSVNVIPYTTAGSISGSSFVCAGATSTYTDSVLAGTWSHTNTAIGTLSSSGVLTTGSSASGVDTIKYTVVGSCGTAVATYVVTVSNSASTAAGYLVGLDTLCLGGRFRIIDSLGSTGGVWHTSTSRVATVDGSGNVTAVDTGVTSIWYSVSTGSCGADTSYHTLRVAQTMPPITGSSSVCVRAQDTLSNAVSGGLWSSSNAAIAYAAPGFGTVTGIVPGSVTITYTTSIGCRTTYGITVNPIPTPIRGTFVICENGTQTLIDTAHGGLWSSSDNTIATVGSTTGVVRGRVAGTAYISYTYPTTGCFVDTPFVVNPNPTYITGRPALCQFDFDTLANLTTGGVFSSSNTSVATVNPSTGLLRGVTGGSINVSYTLGTGCYSTKPVTIHPLPRPTVLFNVGTGTLGTHPWYVSYQWYRNGALIPGAIDSTVAAFFSGNYVVHVVDTFGCDNVDSLFVTDAMLDVENTQLKGRITVSPNPANNFVDINAPFAISASILSMDGKVVSAKNKSGRIDISNFAPGVYFINIYDAEDRLIKTEKLIKE